MFDDSRSRKIILVAHCILNQNAVSESTAAYPGTIRELVTFLNASDAGIVQMPCPELHCLGLDRGNRNAGASPVLVENTRIRSMMRRKPAQARIQQMVQHLFHQISEYKSYGFDILGIVGVNRSPSCGVDTTSADNSEVCGEGIFIEALRGALEKNGIVVPMVGVRAFEPEQMFTVMQSLFM